MIQFVFFVFLLKVFCKNHISATAGKWKKVLLFKTISMEIRHGNLIEPCTVLYQTEVILCVLKTLKTTTTTKSHTVIQIKNK